MLPLLAGLLALALLAWLVQREKAAQRGRRGRLLADCLPLFETAVVTGSGDGFPRLAGTIAGRRVQVEFVPDSMTIRRLPQLWMSLTILDTLPVPAAIGVLARPAGTEFYAVTPTLPQRLEVQPPFAPEVQLRGAAPEAAALLPLVAEPMARLLADPRVKEVVVAPKGLRAVYQAAEGRRGQHLLLRQCDFGDAMVEPSRFLALHDGLDAIAAALLPQRAPQPAARGEKATPPRIVKP